MIANGKRRRKLILDVKIGPTSTDHWTLAGHWPCYVTVDVAVMTVGPNIAFSFVC